MLFGRLSEPIRGRSRSRHPNPQGKAVQIQKPRLAPSCWSLIDLLFRHSLLADAVLECEVDTALGFKIPMLSVNLEPPSVCLLKGFTGRLLLMVAVRLRRLAFFFHREVVLTWASQCPIRSDL